MDEAFSLPKPVRSLTTWSIYGTSTYYQLMVNHEEKRGREMYFLQKVDEDFPAFYKIARKEADIQSLLLEATRLAKRDKTSTIFWFEGILVIVDSTSDQRVMYVEYCRAKKYQHEKTIGPNSAPYDSYESWESSFAAVKAEDELLRVRILNEEDSRIKKEEDERNEANKILENEG